MPPWPKPPDPWFAALRLPHFPAQALSAENPSLKNRAFAVVEQNAESHKTPLLAVSKIAREQHGVEAGTPAFLATRRFRGLRVLSRDQNAERRLRGALSAFLYSHTPVHSIKDDGKAMLDMTGTPSIRMSDPEIWSKRIWSGVMGLGLEEASVGAGSSQIMAQVSAKLADPGGVRVCRPGREKTFLAPLPPGVLPGLSPHARERLRKYGLVSVGQVERLDKEELALRFGNEAEKIYCLARGLDFEAVAPKVVPVAVETTLARDLNDQDALRGQVRLTADKLCHALRRREFVAADMTLILRYSDGRSFRKTARWHSPISEFLNVAARAERLFAELHQSRVALRCIRLQVASPAVDPGQSDLFDIASTHKQAALALALDRIRVKKKFTAVINASGVSPQYLI